MQYKCHDHIDKDGINDSIQLEGVTMALTMHGIQDEGHDRTPGVLLAWKFLCF